MREFEAEKTCALFMRCGLCVELSRLRNCAHAPVPAGAGLAHVGEDFIDDVRLGAGVLKRVR